MNEKKKTPIVICALYTFFIFASFAVYVSIFGFLPEYVGSDLVTVSGSQSVFAAVMTIANLVAASIFKKMGSKYCMIFSGVLMLVYGGILGFLPSVTTLYLAFAIQGIVFSFGGLTSMGDYLVCEYGADAGKYMSVIVGTSLIAQGATQGLAGVLYEKLGMTAVFRYQVIGAAVIAIVFALMLKNNKPVSAAAEDPAAEKQTKASASAVSVFKMPSAWIFWIITAISGGVIIPVLMYATVYFPSFGQMSISGASTLVLVLGLATGVYNLVINGKVLQKIGVKALCVLIFVCAVGINVMAIVYAGVPNMAVIALIVVFYAIGCTSSSLYAIVSPIIFGPELSTQVMTKAAAFLGLGNIALPVIFASIITNSGMKAAFILAIALSVICAVLFFVLFATMKKNSAEN